MGLAVVALFYGLYRLVLVVMDARLQERIDGTARATVTSVAGLGTELATFALYAAWTLGGVMLVAALLLVIAASLPRLLRVRTQRERHGQHAEDPTSRARPSRVVDHPNSSTGWPPTEPPDPEHGHC
jgi:hypothetical protein